MKLNHFNLRTGFLTILAVAFLCAFYRTAWVAEDAFITFRVIDNWIEGYGLRWNVTERVQAYTHPLWLLLLTPLILLIADPYWSVMILSAVLLFVLIILIVAAMDGPHAFALICTASLLWSQAFVDYSSSGLENPLTHVLLTAFVICARRHDKQTISVLAFLVSLVYLTRPDAILLLLPALLLFVLRADVTWTQRIFRLTIGFTPIIVWITFSLIYYGALVPNTALAKLQNGVDIGRSIGQGWNLIMYSIENDLPTILIVLSGAAIGTIQSRSRPLVMGLLLWFGYFFYSGGDYMAGRFFSGPLVLSVIILGMCLRGIKPSLIMVGCLLAVSPSLNATILSPISFSSTTIRSDGIANERAFYYSFLGMRPVIQSGWNRHPWLREGYSISGTSGGYIKCVIGMVGYGAGPNVKILDPFALADPFLARLPARSNARVGHYERGFPDGFLESYVSNVNHLSDENLALLWDDLRLATTAPIMSEGRLGAIFRLNFRRSVYKPAIFDKEAVGLPGAKSENRAEHSCLGVPYGGLYLWQLF